MKALFAGSFNPPTLGHLDLITRAAGMFDTVLVAVLGNPDKRGALPMDRRAEMLRRITKDLPNVEVTFSGGLLTDLARETGSDVVLRGVRGTADLPFEMQLANAYRTLGGIETLFMSCSPQYCMLSSTIVRDCAAHGAPLDAMVPGELIDEIYAAYGNTPNAEKEF